MIPVPDKGAQPGLTNPSVLSLALVAPRGEQLGTISSRTLDGRLKMPNHFSTVCQSTRKPLKAVGNGIHASPPPEIDTPASEG
jgi:hypothetical protein